MATPLDSSSSEGDEIEYPHILGYEPIFPDARFQANGQAAHGFHPIDSQQGQGSNPQNGSLSTLGSYNDGEEIPNENHGNGTAEGSEISGDEPNSDDDRFQVSSDSSNGNGNGQPTHGFHPIHAQQSEGSNLENGPSSTMVNSNGMEIHVFGNLGGFADLQLGNSSVNGNGSNGPEEEEAQVNSNGMEIHVLGNVDGFADLQLGNSSVNGNGSNVPEEKEEAQEEERGREEAEIAIEERSREEAEIALEEANMADMERRALLNPERRTASM